MTFLKRKGSRIASRHLFCFYSFPSRARLLSETLSVIPTSTSSAACKVEPCMLTERRSYNFGRSGVPRMHDQRQRHEGIGGRGTRTCTLLCCGSAAWCLLRPPAFSPFHQKTKTSIHVLFAIVRTALSTPAASASTACLTSRVQYHRYRHDH